MSSPALLALAIAAISPASTEPAIVAADYLDLALVSEHRAFVPGRPASLGLRLRHAAQWHSYWINPGDSGLPTRLEWTLPAGWHASDIAWPAPTRFEVSGLYNFGYDGDMLLPVVIDVPADAAVGTEAGIAVEAKWLVCREECIPGKAILHLNLPIMAAGNAPSSDAWRFDATRRALPEPAAWTGSAWLDGDRIVITLRGDDLPEPTGLDVFAVQRRVLANAPPRLRREADALVIDAGQSDYFDEPPATLDLVLTNGSARARQVRVAFVALPNASTRSK